MKCPTCENVSLTMSERQGVEIDYCPQCRGVWLDRGELDKVIERSSTGQASAATAPTEYRESRGREQHSDEYYKKKKKKEGFLSDLFDF